MTDNLNINAFYVALNIAWGRIYMKENLSNIIKCKYVCRAMMEIMMDGIPIMKKKY